MYLIVFSLACQGREVFNKILSRPTHTSGLSKERHARTLRLMRIGMKGTDAATSARTMSCGAPIRAYPMAPSPTLPFLFFVNKNRRARPPYRYALGAGNSGDPGRRYRALILERSAHHFPLILLEGGGRTCFIIHVVSNLKLL